jgi:hypothetical protein
MEAILFKTVVSFFVCVFIGFFVALATSGNDEALAKWYTHKYFPCICIIFGSTIVVEIMLF